MPKIRLTSFIFLFLITLFSSCREDAYSEALHSWSSLGGTELQADSSFADSLSTAALSLTEDHVRYDPGYYNIDYPGGDVPADIGVCTDVVIRAYRKMGLDLQVVVHEDMKKHFDAYPKLWAAKQTDSNIDHRRVPNLMTYFDRMGCSKAMSDTPADYLPGDIVCWNLGGAITHIGLVTDQYSSDGKRPLIVHNIGAGQVLEDCLFRFKQIGHYRYPSAGN